ncbi:MAG: hypothetical protein M3O86_02415 [Actinomycetota bacterium]|nr:hypothetical protein [Actinomycetota bacterium]
MISCFNGARRQQLAGVVCVRRTHDRQWLATGTTAAAGRATRWSKRRGDVRPSAGSASRALMALAAFGAVLLAGLAVARAVPTVGQVLGDRLSGRVVTADAGYAFDVADEERVTGYAHFVFAGQVRAQRGVVATVFEVAPVTQLKGTVPERVLVSQEAFTTGTTAEGHAGQRRLQVNGTYLFALTVPGDDLQSDVLTLLAGPVSGQPVDPADEATMSRLERAVTAEQWPPEFDRKGAQARHVRTGSRWAALPPGYATSASSGPKRAP